MTVARTSISVLFLSTALSSFHACRSVEAPAPEPAKELSLLDSLRDAELVELNFVWDEDSPLLELNPPFAFELVATHAATAGSIPGGIAFAADAMTFSGQHGAPTIDALGHISNDLELFGGLDATASEGPSGLTALGIDAYPAEKFINRGVLLDVARFKGGDALEAGYEITAKDLEDTAQAQGVSIQTGDSVLIRTGYGKFFESDKEKYMGLRPGPGEEAAHWLAEKDIFLAGADQLTFEVAPEGGSVFPVHRVLIADHGVYLIENMNLEALAALLAERDDYSFVLVVNPPRLGGATASPLNAFAIVP